MGRLCLRYCVESIEERRLERRVLCADETDHETGLWMPAKPANAKTRDAVAGTVLSLLSPPGGCELARQACLNQPNLQSFFSGLTCRQMTSSYFRHPSLGAGIRVEFIETVCASAFGSRLKAQFCLDMPPALTRVDEESGSFYVKMVCLFHRQLTSRPNAASKGNLPMTYGKA
ncbi:unnamed protein product [Protopolystoma xenopodis]|uniref:Uncharacterized protein n=1 Tax=Protopolystoma xenopodis TaxID=117903 RepID=A0A3S5AK61_9PLAT|nr:unnamed protein product [Protopolystoma xenopodis]